MPTSTEVSPEDIDQLRQEETMHELVEQGGVEPLADDPFDPKYLEQLTQDEKKKLALAHDYRDARKLQYVINRGDLTTTEVSQASTKGVQEMIEQRFDPTYRLQMMKPDKPEQVVEKDPGQLAEETLVKLFNESDLNVHAELGSDYLDNTGKSDLILFIPSPSTKGKEIVLKIQVKSNPPADEAKRLQAKTPNALLVRFADITSLEGFVAGDQGYEYKWAHAVESLAEKGNLMEKRNFVSQYLKRTVATLLATPPDVYPAAKRALKV